MPTREELERKEDELEEALGYHPAFVGSAALAGGEAINTMHPASIAAQLLAKATRVGDKIPAKVHGKRIDTVRGRVRGGLSAEQIRALREFRKAKGIEDVPILGGRVAHAIPVDAPEVKIKGRTLLREVKRRAVMDTTSVPVGMHELGHTTPLLRGKVPGLTTAWHTFHGLSSSPLVRWPLMAQVLAPPDDEDGAVRRFAYDHAPELVAASYLPRVLEEARATGHALHGAHKFGPGALRAAKELAPALGTYLATGLLPPVLATILGKKLIEHLYRKGEDEGQEKTSSGLLAMVRLHHLKQAADFAQTPPKPIKPQGALRNSLAVAYSSKPPKPVTTPMKALRSSQPHETGVKGSMPIAEDKRFHNDMRLATMGRGARTGVPSIGR